MDLFFFFVSNERHLEDRENFWSFPIRCRSVSFLLTSLPAGNVTTKQHQIPIKAFCLWGGQQMLPGFSPEPFSSILYVDTLASCCSLPSVLCSCIRKHVCWESCEKEEIMHNRDDDDNGVWCLNSEEKCCSISYIPISTCFSHCT